MTATILAILMTITQPVDFIDEEDAIQAPDPVAYYTTPEERQVLIHGAGGCTPNFSTGGCL